MVHVSMAASWQARLMSSARVASSLKERVETPAGLRSRSRMGGEREEWGRDERGGGVCVGPLGAKGVGKREGHSG
eukprot:scaffold32580_cov40-Tisochrysis_lutea.AAC.1